MTKQWSQNTSEYFTLRQQLDTLEYQEYLPEEAVPLVKRLFSDLLQTTKTSKSLVIRNKDLEHEIEFLETSTKPIKLELSKQVEQQTQLHKEIIKTRDEFDLYKKSTSKTIREMDSKIQDLTFMNHHLCKKIQQKDYDKQEFKNKMQDLVIEPKLVDKIQKIDLETGLEPITTNYNYNLNNQYDLIKMSDLIRIELETKLKEAEIVLKSNEFEMETLSTKLQARNEYIDKLSCTLQLEPKQDKYESQILLLNEHIQQLENELENIEEKKMFVQSNFIKESKESKELLIKEQQKNQDLIKQLIRLEQMINQLESEYKEKKSIKNTIENTKNTKQNKRENDLEKKIILMENELKRVKNQNLKNINKIKELKREKDNKILNGKCKDDRDEGGSNGKDDNGRDGKDEGGRDGKDGKDGQDGKDDNGRDGKDDNGRDGKDGKDGKVVYGKDDKDENVKMNILKLQNENIQLKEMNSTLIFKNEQNERNLNDLKIEKTSLMKQLESLTSERNSLIEALEQFEIELGDVNERAKRVTEDRDCLNSLYKQVNEEVMRLRTVISDQSKSTNTNINENKNNLCTNSDKIIPTGKRNTINTNTSINIPISNRNNINSNTSSNSPTNNRNNNSDHIKIKELEKELERYKKTNETLVQEINDLKQDIKELYTRQRDSGNVATEAVLQIDKELAALQDSLKEKDSLIVDYQQKIQETKLLLNQSESKLIDLSNLNQKLTRKQQEAETFKSEINLKQRELKSKLAESEREVGHLNQENKVLKQDLESKQKDLGDQRGLIEKIDAERDVLINQLDSKTEKLSSKEDEFKAIEKQLEITSTKLQDSCNQISTLSSHLNARDKECLLASREIESLKTKCIHYESNLQDSLLENQKLASDLMVLTRENQILNSELHKVSNASEKYRGELMETDNQIQNLNEFIKTRDDEKQQFLINYRKLIMAHEKLDQNLRDAVNECDVLRIQLLAKEKSNSKMSLEIGELSKQLNQSTIDYCAIEKQYSLVSKSLATSERKVKQLENEQARLQIEIARTRDFVHTVDRDRDDTKSQLISMKLEIEKLSQLMEKTSVEKAALEANIESLVLFSLTIATKESKIARITQF
jgi:chromosome segregation ATPase